MCDLLLLVVEKAREGVRENEEACFLRIAALFFFFFVLRSSDCLDTYAIRTHGVAGFPWKTKLASRFSSRPFTPAVGYIYSTFIGIEFGNISSDINNINCTTCIFLTLQRNILIAKHRALNSFTKYILSAMVILLIFLPLFARRTAHITCISRLFECRIML